MSATSRRPVAAAKSRKNLVKQAGSFVGRSQPQPQALAATALPAAPLVVGNQANAQFSFNSGTMPEKETSLPAAPLVFGNQANAQFSFNSGSMHEKETSLPAAPLFFGNQNQSSTQFAFTSATQPEEESLEKMAADMEAELANPLTSLGNTHVTHYPDYGLDRTFGLDTDVPAAPEVAQDPNVTQYPDPDTAYSLPYFAQNSNIQDPGLSRSSSSQGPKPAVDPSFISGLDTARDPVAENSSLDPNLSFPLDPNLGLSNERRNAKPFAASTMPPALSVTQYPDPNIEDTAYSSPYFVQDSNGESSELSRPDSSQNPKSAADPSFLPSLNVVQDPIAQDLSFHQEPNFPLDPNLDLSNEHDNLELIAAFNATSAPSVTEYPDPNVPDTARFFPYFIPDSNAQDSELPRPNFPQSPKSAADPSFLPGFNVVQDHIVQYLGFHSEPSFPLDPNLGSNKHDNLKLIAAFNATSDLSVTEYPDPKVPDTTRSLPYFLLDSNAENSELPRPNSSQTPKSAVQDPTAQGLSFHQEPSFPLDPNLGLSNEHDNLKLIAAFNATSAPSVTQYPELNASDTACSYPYFVQDSNIRDPELPHPISSQDSKFAVDSTFVPNPKVASQDPIARDSVSHQELSFPLDPNLGLANEHGNHKLIAAFNATTAPNVAQHSDIPDFPSFLPNFVQNSTVQDLRMPLPNSSQDLDSAADPSFIPNHSVAQDPTQDLTAQDPTVQDHMVQDPIVQNPTAQGPIVQDPTVQDPIVQDPIVQDPFVQNLSLHQEPSFVLGPQYVLANEHGNLKPITTFNATPALNVAQHPNVSDLSSFVPNFIQDSSVQYPRMPLTNRSQDPKPSVDPTHSFVPNLNVARNLLAKQASVPLDPSLGLADERANLQPAAAFAAPALNSIQPQPISENNANFERKDQYQDLQSNSGFQVNMLDPNCAFDINTSGFEQNQRVEMPGFPKSPSTTGGQNLDENEDSQFDLMDLAPDYKTTPPSWKHNQLTQNRFDSLGRGGLPENPTNPNLVSVPGQISSSVAFMEHPQPLKASAQGADLNKSLDQAQTRNISREPATENVTPLCDSIASTVAPHQDPRVATLQVEREAIDQREMEKLKAEIERQSKAINDKDEKIRQNAHELQDQKKKSIHMIKQLRGDLDNLREEKSTLEKANRDLAADTREMKDLQGKEKKNTDLIKRLSGELGSLRRKKSSLEKANESLAKENVEMKVDLDNLCQSSLGLKEENRNLNTAVNDLRPLNLMLDEAKENLWAQNVEIEDKTKKIATLNACIDQISPELLWRTEQLREVEDLVLFEESISKWYRDRYYLLWEKNEALESAGVLRDMEIAKLELEKERKHQKELEALRFRIAGLEMDNKSPAQRLGEIRVDAERADTADEKVWDVYDDGWARFTNEIQPLIQELPLPNNEPDEDQKPSRMDEEVGNPSAYASYLSAVANIVLVNEGFTAITAGTIKDLQKKQGPRTPRSA